MGMVPMLMCFFKDRLLLVQKRGKDLSLHVVESTHDRTTAEYLAVALEGWNTDGTCICPRFLIWHNRPRTSPKRNGITCMPIHPSKLLIATDTGRLKTIEQFGPKLLDSASHSTKSTCFRCMMFVWSVGGCEIMGPCFGKLKKQQGIAIKMPLPLGFVVSSLCHSCFIILCTLSRQCWPFGWEGQWCS